MGPFFQGGIQDLMNVAGPSNGGFLLGQMMAEQRKAQEQELQKSMLANMEKQQQMKFAADKHPLDMDELKVKIDKWKADNEQTKEQTRGTKLTNDVNEAVGVPTLVQGKTVDIEEKKLKVSDEQRKQWANTFMTTEWSPSLFRNLPELMTKMQLPTEVATQAATAAQNKESWDAFRNNYYKSTPGARKEAQAQEGRMAVEGERSSRAIAAAQARERRATTIQEQLLKAKSAKERHALLVYAQRDAELNGDMEDAKKWAALAESQRPQAEAEIAAASRAPTIDPGAVTGLPTTPPASIAPDRTRAPGTVPGEAVPKQGRTSLGKVYRVIQN